MRQLKTGKIAEYNALSDKELVGLLQTSDYTAFTEIYNRFAGILFVFIRKRVGDKDDAKDIVQELFTELWIKRETIEVKGELTSYLYVAIRHKMINYIQRNVTQKKYIDAIENFTGQETVMTDHLVREKQLAALIEQQIDQLPKKMREVFLLSRNANLTYSEIAEELNLSKQTIRSHAKNAIKILRLKLGLIVIFFIFF